ncbi:hypothetical protein EYV94_22300 [Puteibacter caeruleilacunae]|nr:hypothetical protein EYV94_22300 [Puteibacter caeruleilacunae]
MTDYLFLKNDGSVLHTSKIVIVRINMSSLNYFKNKSTYWTISFVVIMLFVGAVYKYHKTTKYPPQGMHAWRQADSASFALNYYTNGMDFWQPELLNLRSDDRQTGYSVSEAPLLYYGVAILYKIFGYHDFWFRLTNLIIAFLGMFYLFRFAYDVTKDYLWAVLIGIMPFMSTIYSYYANNFITDITAFNFMLIAAYHAYRFLQKERRRSLIYFGVMVCLAGLMKITSLVAVIALCCTCVLVIPFLKAKRKDWLSLFGTIFVALFINFLWYKHAFSYNEKHSSIYFANNIYPAWNFTWLQIKTMLTNIWNARGKDYFSIYLWYFLGVALIFVLFNLRKIKREVLIYLGILFVGVLSYVAMWIFKMKEHDYYFAPVLPLFVGLLLLFVVILKKRYSSKVSTIVAGIFMLVCLISIGKVRSRIDYKYTPLKELLVYQEMEPILRQHGIHRTDAVVSLSDPTNAMTLYLMNQRGWTRLDGHTSPAKIWKRIGDGAKYLLVSNPRDMSHSLFQCFYKEMICEHKGVRLYDLRNLHDPYKDYELNEIFCAVEQQSSDGEYILSSDPYMYFSGGKAITVKGDEKCCTLNNKNPYGMGTTIPNVKGGDHIRFEFKNAGQHHKGLFHLSVEGGFKRTIEIDDVNHNEWEQSHFDFDIPDQVEGDLVFFFSNQAKEDLLLDDLRIKRIESNSLPN